jgi:hypothetical protein
MSMDEKKTKMGMNSWHVNKTIIKAHPYIPKTAGGLVLGSTAGTEGLLPFVPRGPSVADAAAMEIVQLHP